jgi:hypothetical protein
LRRCSLSWAWRSDGRPSGGGRCFALIGPLYKGKNREDSGQSQAQIGENITIAGIEGQLFDWPDPPGQIGLGHQLGAGLDTAEGVDNAADSGQLKQRGTENSGQMMSPAPAAEALRLSSR